MSDTEARSGQPPEQSNNPACNQCRARKVRCDRRRPECSNCSKAGVCCDFTNQSKRVNHTKQLLNDFSSVTSRLESIEAAIRSLSTELVTVKQLITSSSSSSSWSQSSSVSGKEFFRDFLEECQAQEVESGDEEPTEFAHQGSACCGCEQFFGETSAHSLFKSARERTELLLRTANQDAGNSPLASLVKDQPAIAYDLQRAYDAFPTVEECYRPFPAVSGMNGANGRPTMLPPKTFLLSAIDIYLSEINLYNPIFNESSLREAVELQYSTPALSQDTDREVWSLCFNNIILLAMYHSARFADSAAGDFPGIEHDLLQSFLRNTCRAFYNLERLSTPRFVNIQALATLALVGRDCFEGCFASQMLPRVFQIVRSTGLHRAQAYEGTTGASTDERRMLCWSLYRLDKYRCFMKGQPCDLYRFDTDIPMASYDEESSASRFHFALNSLMVIWEKIYLLLYSPQVKMRRRRYTDQTLSELEMALKYWYWRHSEFLEQKDVDKCEGSSIFFRAELRFCFAMSSLLIQRCINSPANRRKCLESARTALRIIANMQNVEPRSGSIAFLSRIFLQYPALPFLEVYHYILENPTPERLSQAHLLTSAVRAVGDLVNPNFPRVFCSLLYTRMSWCLEVIEILQPSLSSPLYPSRKESVASGVISRNRSMLGLADLDVAALNAFPSSAASESALFGTSYAIDGSQTSDNIRGTESIFGGSDLSANGFMMDVQDTNVPMILDPGFSNSQADYRGMVIGNGPELFGFNMEAGDALWNVDV